MEEVAVLEVRIGVATRTRGAGGGRLQVSKLAAAIQDEVAPGENVRMTPCAADARARVFVIAQLIYMLLLSMLPRRAPRTAGQSECRTPHRPAARRS